MRILIVTLFVVITDQLSKLAIKGFSIPSLNINYSGMFEGERIQVIGNFFRITFIENPGMAFGLNPGINFKIWITIFSIIASIGIIVYLFKMKDSSFPLRFSLALILGGAIGNLIDRVFYGVFYNYAPLFYGRVVDFLDVNFFRFTLFGRTFDRWPIFNFADVAVTIGVFILLFANNKKKEKDLAVENVEANKVVADN